MLNSMPVFGAVAFWPAASSSSTSLASSSVRPITAKADVVAIDRVQLEAQIALQQRHQHVDFGHRTLPVFDRERVERQHLDAEARRRLDDLAHRLDAGAVAFDARQMPLRRPPPVAVHDDGDVRGQRLEVHLAGQRLVGRSSGDLFQKLLERHVQEKDTGPAVS